MDYSLLNPPEDRELNDDVDRQHGSDASTDRPRTYKDVIAKDTHNRTECSHKAQETEVPAAYKC